MARFDDCLAFTLKAEGGWVDRADDDGGPTNDGITLATLREFLRYECPPNTLRYITPAWVRNIYDRQFWTPLGCADLPPGVDLMVFDFGVNAGWKRSYTLLQDVVGAAVDGKPGPKTLAAVKASPVQGLVLHLADAQRAYYKSLSKFPTFGRGWLARTQLRMEAAIAAIH